MARFFNTKHMTNYQCSVALWLVLVGSVLLWPLPSASAATIFVAHRVQHPPGQSNQ